MADILLQQIIMSWISWRKKKKYISFGLDKATISCYLQWVVDSGTINLPDLPDAS